MIFGSLDVFSDLCVSAIPYKFSLALQIDVECNVKVLMGSSHLAESTISQLQAHVKKIEAKLTPNIYYKNQRLCSTSSGNDCNILTVTERPNVDDPHSAITFRK